ncbi:MAG: hypothetical protein AAGK21_00275 [Bacteroidota bacterium]
MPRRYSEEEAQRIFALVAERQRTTAGADGLSLSELEEAARAAGLDPSLVAVAAAELDAAPHAEKTLAGLPVEVIRSRVVPGTLDDDGWSQVVTAARHEFGEPGMAGQIGRLREWMAIMPNSNGNTSILRLTAEPTPDGTRLTLSRSIRQTVIGLSIGTAITAIMAGIFLPLGLTIDPELLVVAGIMAVMAVVFGTGLALGTRTWQHREAGRFERLLSRLELVTRDASAASVRAPAEVSSAQATPDASMPAEPRAAESRLDLDSLSGAPDTAGARARTRLRS